MTSLRQESHERADLVRLSESDSNIGKQCFQDFLGGLLTMKPDNLITDVLRGKHFIKQSFILGGLAEQQ
jgi:hypothetical protein